MMRPCPRRKRKEETMNERSRAKGRKGIAFFFDCFSIALFFLYDGGAHLVSASSSPLFFLSFSPKPLGHALQGAPHRPALHHRHHDQVRAAQVLRDHVPHAAPRGRRRHAVQVEADPRLLPPLRRPGGGHRWIGSGVDVQRQYHHQLQGPLHAPGQGRDGSRGDGGADGEGHGGDQGDGGLVSRSF